MIAFADIPAALNYLFPVKGTFLIWQEHDHTFKLVFLPIQFIENLARFVLKICDFFVEHLECRQCKIGDGHIKNNRLLLLIELLQKWYIFIIFQHLQENLFKLFWFCQQLLVLFKALLYCSEFFHNNSFNFSPLFAQIIIIKQIVSPYPWLQVILYEINIVYSTFGHSLFVKFQMIYNILFDRYKSSAMLSSYNFQYLQLCIFNIQFSLIFILLFVRSFPLVILLHHISIISMPIKSFLYFLLAFLHVLSFYSRVMFNQRHEIVKRILINI